MNKSTKVLVADNSQAIVNVVTKLLQQCGFSDIEHTYTAEEALEALRARRHHLVLSDYNFGDMNGVQLLLAVRSDTLLNNTCFILMTAIRDRQVLDAAMRFQADGILIKPFTADVLKMKLAHLPKLKTRNVEVAFLD
jgi:two-component system chemotaxis response regulator CheY